MNENEEPKTEERRLGPLETARVNTVREFQGRGRPQPLRLIHGPRRVLDTKSPGHC